MKTQQPVVENLSFGKLSLFEEYAVIECFWGVDVGYPEIEELKRSLFPHYKNRIFGLVANRVNQYSVKLLAIKDLFSAQNLVAGAIIPSSSVGKIAALMEDEIVEDAPIQVFSILNEAITWVLDQVAIKNQKERFNKPEPSKPEQET